jgi:glycosyltransferase involved in cell wall biosynthesis
LLNPVRTVALVRNAIYFDEEFLKRERPLRRLSSRLQGALIALGARRCARVQYPSDSMRKLVERQYPELAPVGEANHFGVGHGFVNGRKEEPIDVDRAPTKPISFLYVMNYTLQKNLEYLLRALSLARKAGLPVRVVVTSRLDRGPRSCFDEDRALIEANDLIGSGYLAPVGPKYNQELIDLYHSVDGGVFPSMCEAFGHPMIEALTMGKPLICADRPIAREICGDYALYVDPRRPEDLVKIWENWPAVVARLPKAPLDEILRRFSWETHVARLLDALLGEEDRG